MSHGVLNQAGCQPNSAYIGDHPHDDIRGLTLAGMHSILANLQQSALSDGDPRLTGEVTQLSDIDAVATALKTA